LLASGSSKIKMEEREREREEKSGAGKEDRRLTVCLSNFKVLQISFCSPSSLRTLGHAVFFSLFLC